MPLWEDNTSKEERRIAGNAVISKFREYILLNKPFLSLHEMSEFLSSLALVDLPEQERKATPYYLICPLG